MHQGCDVLPGETAATGGNEAVAHGERLQDILERLWGGC